MKTSSLILTTFLLALTAQLAIATEADDTTVTITGQTAGATPFLSQLSLVASDPDVIKSIQFTIAKRPFSVIRPLSATYSHDYLVSNGFLLPNGNIFLPVHGLFADYTNTITLTYLFLDGSSKQDSTTITTAAFDDQGCGYNTPTKFVIRTPNTNLSYDYIFDRSGCGDFSPVILDSDGFLRWVSPLATNSALVAASTFFDGAAYTTDGSTFYRIDLSGTITSIADYGSMGVVSLHHNIDTGKTGVLLAPDTTTYYESEVMEVDPVTGAVLKTFNMADIISAAMIAGGDDPSQFVFPTPTDWFHNNGSAYYRADDSIVISSRENFLICLDYETSAIKWILGDPTKKWHQFPSLAQFALTVAPGSLPPIGQHAPSITYDEGVMVFDNGEMSLFQVPPGEQRTYASPRKYSVNPTSKTATEVWNYPMDESIFSPFCGSIYEDAPLNYVIDYAFVNGIISQTTYAQLLGLDAAGEQVFYYQYPTLGCDTAYNSLPIHLESTKFPAVGPKALNLSTRGTVSNGDDTLIGGFIVTGNSSKKVALRVLGPSLANSGVSGAVADPILTLFDSSGNLIATNDDWATDPGAAELTADGLAPTSAAEAATVQTLVPAAYTVVSRSKDATSGLGLVEAYDLTAETDSQLANISTRGMVGTGDNVLISGFSIGDVANATVIVRALGPSLAAASVPNPLADPLLTVYDQNGAVIATNDNWQDDVNSSLVDKNGLAPSDPAESAIVLNLPAAAYTAIVSGANSSTGNALVEFYDLQ